MKTAAYNNASPNLRTHCAMAHNSMTGFGSSQADSPAGRLLLDVRSVNSRFFELNVRMPDEFRWAEAMIRDKVQSRIQRGKVDLRLSLARTESGLAQTAISASGLASALRLSHQIRQDHPEITPFSVSDLLRLPGVTSEPQLSQDDWGQHISGLLDDALERFQASRQSEGERLADIIATRIDALRELLVRVVDLVPQALETQRAKLASRMREALEAVDAGREEALEERIRQEAALFGLRIDIAEEADRLGTHLKAAELALGGSPQKGGGVASLGKRLDFLTQEMNRETNTMGSKSASAELSQIVIEMKLLIEQIREQAQNLE